MRCDEIRERFVDLLYDEKGTPPASPELRAHLDSCPACRDELRLLRGAQTALRSWTEEAPLRPVLLPLRGGARAPRPAALRWLRTASWAAALLLAFLALANAEIRWNKDGFLFRTGLWRQAEPQGASYSRDETRDLIKRALEDSEARMMDTNYLMMQRAMDLMDQERYRDLRYIRDLAGRGRPGN